MSLAQASASERDERLDPQAGDVVQRIDGSTRIVTGRRGSQVLYYSDAQRPRRRCSLAGWRKWCLSPSPARENVDA